MRVSRLLLVHLLIQNVILSSGKIIEQSRKLMILTDWNILLWDSLVDVSHLKWNLQSYYGWKDICWKSHGLKLVISLILQTIWFTGVLEYQLGITSVLYISLCIYPSIHRSISSSIHRSISSSIHQSISSSIHRSISSSIHRSIWFIHFFIHLSISAFSHSSIHQFIHSFWIIH